MRGYITVIMITAIFLAVFADRCECRLPPPSDDLLEAIYSGYKQIAEGGSREEALEGIMEKLKANRGSRYVEKAEQDIADLTTTIEKTKKLSYKPEDIRRDPVSYLVETKFPLYMIMYRANWKSLDKMIVEPKYENDPAVLLIKQGRDAMPQLIEALDDRSMTRFLYISGHGDLQYIPRTNDYAIFMIEYLTKSRFHFPFNRVSDFSEKDDEETKEAKEYIGDWWKTYKDKPIIDGIKAQISHVDYYARIEMAENAIDIGEREYGIFILKDMILKMEPRPAHIARILAAHDDLTLMGVIVDRARARGGCGDETAFYIMENGGRAEWEYLHEVLERKANDMEKGVEDIPNRYLIHSVAGTTAKKANESLYAIPVFAVGLRYTENSGSRWVSKEVGSQSYSPADDAAEKLQKLTGEDFGYRRESSQEERSAAIKKARQWWEETGQKKYTYRKIERMMKKKE